jgi:hypothetical protein
VGSREEEKEDEYEAKPDECRMYVLDHLGGNHFTRSAPFREGIDNDEAACGIRDILLEVLGAI